MIEDKTKIINQSNIILMLIKTEVLHSYLRDFKVIQIQISLKELLSTPLCSCLFNYIKYLDKKQLKFLPKVLVKNLSLKKVSLTASDFDPSIIQLAIDSSSLVTLKTIKILREGARQ